jgi:hypothetical protein
MNLISDALKRGKAAASHLVTTHQPIQHIQAGGLNLPQSQVSVNYRNTKTMIVNPTSQPVNPLTSGGFVDFRLTSSDSIKGITFAITLHRDSTYEGYQTLEADKAIDMLTHYEIYTENGSLLCTRTEAAHIKQYMGDLAVDQYNLIKCALEGGNGSTMTQSMPAAGANQVIYIPLLRTFLVDNQIMVSALNSPVTIRLWFNAGCSMSQMKLEISNIQMFVDQYCYDDSIRSQNIVKYQNKLDFRVMCPKYQRSSEVITPGVPFTLRLTSVTGMITSLSVKLYVSNAQQIITKCDLLNEGNQSVLGGQALPHSYLNTVVKARQGRYARTGSAINSDYIFHVQISDHEALNDSQGVIGGYFVSNGYHSLQIYYDSTVYTTPQNCIIEVLYSSVGTFSVNKGVTSMTYS